MQRFWQTFNHSRSGM